MDRDLKLANFQAATNIDDVEMCICILEQHDWDLEASVMSILDESNHTSAFTSNMEGPSLTSVPVSVASVIDDPPVPILQPFPAAQNHTNSRVNTTTAAKKLNHSKNSSTRSSGTTTSSLNTKVTSVRTRRGDLNSLDKEGSMSLHGKRVAKTYDGGASSSTSNSNPKTRYLHFKVDFNKDIYDVILPDTQTVHDIKVQLSDMIKDKHSEISVNVKDMRVLGLKDKNFTDSTVLSRLHLPKETALTVTCPKANLVSCPPETDKEYKLTILNHDQGAVHTLTYKGGATFSQVKGDVYSLWGIGRANQVWTGWPTRCSSSDDLVACGISTEHNLTVRSKDDETRHRNTSSPEAHEHDYDYSYDMMEDDSMLSEPRHPPTVKCLIPTPVSSETEGVEQFTLNFSLRYGENHPIFYFGTLESALKEAANCTIENQRPVVMYLHHDKSITANIFCSTVLVNEGLIEFLNANFVVWPWDMTLPENEMMLLSIVTRLMNLEVAAQIRSLSTDSLPVLLILHKNRGSIDLLHLVNSSNDTSGTLSQLMHAMEQLDSLKAAELAEESARQMREMERDEIESAYKASLALDRKKELQKQEEDKKKADEERALVEEKRKAEELVPEEPAEGTLATTIRIRLPAGGGQQQRRFATTNKMKHLVAFVATLGYASKDFRLVTTFPRKDLSTLPGDWTLQEAGLCPQETVLVEER